MEEFRLLRKEPIIYHAFIFQNAFLFHLWIAILGDKMSFLVTAPQQMLTRCSLSQFSQETFYQNCYKNYYKIFGSEHQGRLQELMKFLKLCALCCTCVCMHTRAFVSLLPRCVSQGRDCVAVTESSRKGQPKHNSGFFSPIIVHKQRWSVGIGQFYPLELFFPSG